MGEATGTAESGHSGIARPRSVSAREHWALRFMVRKTSPVWRYYSRRSPPKGSGMPDHYVGDLLDTVAISGPSRVPTEVFKLTVIPALAPHPEQGALQLLKSQPGDGRHESLVTEFRRQWHPVPITIRSTGNLKISRYSRRGKHTLGPRFCTL